MSLSEALQRAREEELDLMEMGKKDDITLVKMIDYGKYLYRQKKQDQKQKQK
jgi:translation initiation factor IF-3